MAFNLIKSLYLLAVKEAVYIVAAKRTPFGTYGGKLTSWTATDLQEVASKAALEAGKIDPAIISSIIIGNVFHVSSEAGGFCKLKGVFPDHQRLKIL